MEEQRRVLSSINTKPWLVNKFKMNGDYKFAAMSLCRSAAGPGVRHSVHHKQLPGVSVPSPPRSPGAGQEPGPGDGVHLRHPLQEREPPARASETEDVHPAARYPE